jgi:hypothetical protein
MAAAICIIFLNVNLCGICQVHSYLRYKVIINSFYFRRKVTERRGRAVKIPARIRKVPALNIGREAAIMTKFFMASLSSSRIMPGLCHNLLFPKILSSSSFTYHTFIRRYVVCVTEKASLNIL